MRSQIQKSSFHAFFQRVKETTPIRSQNGLARELEVNRSSITQAKRLNNIPETWLLILFRKYRLNPDWLENGTGQPFYDKLRAGEIEYKYIPKVKARLCAGDGSFETNDGLTGHIAFQLEWLRKKGLPDQMVLVDIFGNSMAPELKSGDTVLIDRSQIDIIAGAIYAVGIDDTVMVKRLEKRPRKLVLRSDNPDYDPIILNTSEMNAVRIIGKMVWVCREYR